MWHRQYAFNQREVDILLDLVEEEIKFAHVTNGKANQIEQTRDLLYLHDIFSDKLPTRKPDDNTNTEKGKKTKQKGTDGS